MDWNAVSAVAGVISALFVALSVAYLALQVRAGTRATRSQTYYQTTAALADIAAIIGSDEQVARVVRIGWVTPEKLTEDELTQFGYLMVSFLRRYENVFFQYESGLVDAGFWDGHRENLLWAFRRPGMQLIWKDRKQSFSVGFREFLERSDSIELATPDSRRL